MTARTFILSRWCRIAALTAGLLASAGATWAQTYSAIAEFRPSQIAATQPGAYQVTLTATNPAGNSATPECNPPSVPGLQLNFITVSRGFQSSISFNGPSTTVLTFAFQYQVRADKPGQYTIPAYDLTVNGIKVAVPAATLDVTDKPVSAPVSDVIGLSVKLPRTDVYVGEKLPMDLSLYWRSDVQPQNVDNLQQDNESFERVQLNGRGELLNSFRNNQNYSVNTWHTFLTPLKAGSQNLSFSLPTQVLIPDRNGFGDPLVAQLMGPNSPFSVGEQRSLVPQSEKLDLNVQTLPTTGRPEHFTGGIGTFSVDEPNLSTASLQVGVPVTLTLKVSGEGNFDRFNAPTLDLGPLWRIYPSKDNFTPQDANGYRGTKTFEYVIMPMADNITLLPAPEFNFFNPDSKTYVELPLKSIPVTVKPAEPGQAVPILPAISNTQTASDKPELVPLHIDAGAWQSPQPQLILGSPFFWAGQAVPAVLFAGLVINRRRKLRLENDPAFARRLRARKLAATAVGQAKTAAAKGSAVEFYTIAQRALQEAATHDRLNAAEALTWQEFDAHLAARNVLVDIRQQAREIFEAGDALRFGGYSPDQAQLADAAAKLEGLVQQLLGRA